VPEARKERAFLLPRPLEIVSRRTRRRRRLRRNVAVETVSDAPALIEDVLRVAELELRLLRPAEPEALLDEDAFARDEFLPYWAELWPAGTALARALPERLDGAAIVELGCGLGLPSLVAAARGADVLAVDWAPEATALLERNAARNGVELRTRTADWRAFGGSFDLVLAADVLYEHRNVDPLLGLLPRLAPEALLALAGRPYEQEFVRRAGDDWTLAEVAPRVVRLTRAAHPHAPPQEPPRTRRTIASRCSDAS
jgi:predicted nicotinamide N-methyase